MFKVGDSVKVKAGVKDVEFPDNDTSSWQGEIVEFIEGFAQVKWDNTTLNGMSEKYLEKAEQEGYEIEVYGFGIDEIEPAEPRPEEELEDRYILALDEEKRVAEIIGDKSLTIDDENLEEYLKYLKRKIDFTGLITGREDFPWEERYVFGYGSKSEYEELKESNPSYTDTFLLLDVVYEENSDDGLIGKIKRIKDNKIFQMTLDYLEAKDKKSVNKQLLDDYAFWYVNYR